MVSELQILVSTDIMRNMSETVRGNELFILATKRFLKNENKEMCVALRDHDL